MSAAKQSEVEVKQAILIAKSYITDLFSTDGIKNVGLEEVSFDDAANSWEITVGFSRPWDEAPADRAGILAPLRLMSPDSSQRTYKVVSVDAATGSVRRVSNRPI